MKDDDLDVGNTSSVPLPLVSPAASFGSVGADERRSSFGSIGGDGDGEPSWLRAASSMSPGRSPSMASSVGEQLRQADEETEPAWLSEAARLSTVGLVDEDVENASSSVAVTIPTCPDEAPPLLLLPSGASGASATHGLNADAFTKALSTTRRALLELRALSHQQINGEPCADC